MEPSAVTLLRLVSQSGGAGGREGGRSRGEGGGRILVKTLFTPPSQQPVTVAAPSPEQHTCAHSRAHVCFKVGVVVVVAIIRIIGRNN